MNGLSVGRAADLACSGTMMLHRSGDWEGETADVFYDVRWADKPLVGATGFRHAEEFIQRAEKDPELAAKIDLFIARWERLKRRGSPQAPIVRTPARAEAAASLSASPSRIPVRSD